MSEASRQWRCPYCDGLNAWQDEVCQICGDGRREEAGATGGGEPQMPKTYMPREREPEAEAPRRETATETRTTYAPPPPPEPKKKGKAGVVVAVVVVALAALGGRFLGSSFVKSVEANRATEEPLALIETVAPAQETAAPTEAPAPEAADVSEASVPEARPAEEDKTQIPSYHDYRSGSYGTVTDNGNGTATVRLLDSIPRNSSDRYWIFYYCLGPDPDAESLVEYRLGNATGNVYPTKCEITESLSEPAVITVIPETYTQVVVRTGESYYELEPFYCPKIQRALPFTMQEANILVMDGDEGYREFNRAVSDMQFVLDRDKTVKSIDGLPPRTVYEFTTAEALNDLMENDRQLAFEWIFDLNLGGERYSKWSLEEGNHYVFSTLLSGPGFYEVGFSSKMHMDYDNGDFGVQYDTDRVFFSFYQVIQKFGGYPAGNYTLEFYADGIKMYHYQFTLAGDASQMAEAPEEQDDFELKVGSRGEEVKTMQQALIKMGYLSGSADGIFGNNTQKAVRAFQTAYGVNPSGVVNRREYNMILLSAPSE